MSPNDLKALHICREALDLEKTAGEEITDAFVYRLLEQYRLSVEWGTSTAPNKSETLDGWIIKRDGIEIAVFGGSPFFKPDDDYYRKLSVVRAAADLIQPGWYGPTSRLGRKKKPEL